MVTLFTPRSYARYFSEFPNDAREIKIIFILCIQSNYTLLLVQILDHLRRSRGQPRMHTMIPHSHLLQDGYDTSHIILRLIPAASHLHDEYIDVGTPTTSSNYAWTLGYLSCDYNDVLINNSDRTDCCDAPVMICCNVVDNHLK